MKHSAQPFQVSLYIGKEHHSKKNEKISSCFLT
nr:MAG TPA: hypothetical protein [Caudoviricetes sp.]